MPGGQSENSIIGTVWAPLLPFVPIGPLNPMVVWPSIAWQPYIGFILSIINTPIGVALFGDFNGRARWAQAGPGNTDVLSRTYAHFNALVPGLLKFTPRQHIILAGFLGSGLHHHITPTEEDQWLCTGAQILDIALGDVILSLAIRLGVPIPFSLLVAAAAQIASGIALDGACPETDPPLTTVGTPDPWGYIGR